MVWWDILINRHVMPIPVSYQTSMYYSYRVVCCGTVNLDLAIELVRLLALLVLLLQLAVECVDKVLAGSGS